jgi:hypothetical protein
MVQVLEFPLFHPYFFDLFARPEPGLRDSAIAKVAQFGLDERPQVARSPVDILFDAMKLTVEPDHHPDPEVSRRRHEKILSKIAETVEKLSGFASKRHKK